LKSENEFMKMNLKNNFLKSENEFEK